MECDYSKSDSKVFTISFLVVPSVGLISSLFVLFCIAYNCAQICRRKVFKPLILLFYTFAFSATLSNMAFSVVEVLNYPVDWSEAHTLFEELDREMGWVQTPMYWGLISTLMLTMY